MISKQQTGPLGEDIAARYLQRMDYEILDRNWHCRFGELDIVAKDSDILVFVEVKFRKSTKYGKPIEFITVSKKKKLEKSISFYMSEKFGTEKCWRLDAIGLTQSSGKVSLMHLDLVLGTHFFLHLLPCMKKYRVDSQYENVSHRCYIRLGFHQ